MESAWRVLVLVVQLQPGAAETPGPPALPPVGAVHVDETPRLPASEPAASAPGAVLPAFAGRPPLILIPASLPDPPARRETVPRHAVVPEWWPLAQAAGAFVLAAHVDALIAHACLCGACSSVGVLALLASQAPMVPRGSALPDAILYYGLPGVAFALLPLPLIVDLVAWPVSGLAVAAAADTGARRLFHADRPRRRTAWLARLGVQALAGLPAVVCQSGAMWWICAWQSVGCCLVCSPPELGLTAPVLGMTEAEWAGWALLAGTACTLATPAAVLAMLGLRWPLAAALTWWMEQPDDSSGDDAMMDQPAAG
ncbi:MAG: hypothetical protein HY904_05520 [Deltaproteobacteria bacterium]|nr:hypothetical protein [Deltaproteobacteria bacterium]